jgi:integrase/recombinase XerD
MTITFERRTDRPDAAGRCSIHLRAYFDNQRMRFGTGERCLDSEWNTERAQFRRTFPGFEEANEYLQSLRDRLHAHYRQLRASGAPITPEVLKAALAPPVVAKATPHPWLTDVYQEYQIALQARGHLTTSLVSVATTLTHLSGFEKELKQRLQLREYDLAMHDKFLGYLRGIPKLAQNTVCKTVKHLKAFLRYAHEDRRMQVAIEPRQIKVQWVEVEKVYLTPAELDLLEKAMLPGTLEQTRDAFLFC